MSKDKICNIIAVGDSLTAGYGVDVTESYPSLVTDCLIRDGYDINLVNMGVSGANTADTVKLLPDVLARKPDIVLLEIGINDVIQGKSFTDARENIFQILTSLVNQKITVLLVGMRVNPAISSTYYDEFNNIYPELAEQFSLELMPYFLQDVARKKELNLADGMHPNAKGYEIVVANIYDHVLKVISDWQEAQDK